MKNEKLLSRGTPKEYLGLVYVIRLPGIPSWCRLLDFSRSVLPDKKNTKSTKFRKKMIVKKSRVQKKYNIKFKHQHIQEIFFKNFNYTIIN